LDIPLKIRKFYFSGMFYSGLILFFFAAKAAREGLETDRQVVLTNPVFFLCFGVILLQNFLSNLIYSVLAVVLYPSFLY